MRKEVVRKPVVNVSPPEPTSGIGRRNGSAGKDGVEITLLPPVTILSKYLLGKWPLSAKFLPNIHWYPSISRVP